MPHEPRFRIGELSKRVSISPELLRAWETRYGLLAPERTPGGLRLYSERDERCVREMTRHIAAGLSAAEAARVVLGTSPVPVPAGELLERLDVALTALDEPSAQVALDQTFGSFELEAALAQVILPFLRALGERWAAAQRTIGQEHFASSVVGGRLRSLARGWGDGTGPCALLACPPGEQHELGLVCFGLLLRRRGWKIAYFGAQTPANDLATHVSELAPRLVVLSATGAEKFEGAADEIRALGSLAPLAIGGPGASIALARWLGARLLPADLIAAAEAVSGPPS